MASYTPSVKDVLRAHGCRFERPGKGEPRNLVQSDHATAFPRGRENSVQAHRQRGAETSWYCEAILICPVSATTLVSIPEKRTSSYSAKTAGETNILTF